MSEIEESEASVKKQVEYYVDGTLKHDDLWKPIMKMTQACAEVIKYTTDAPKPDPFHPSYEGQNTWIGGGGGKSGGGGGGGGGSSGGGGCAIL